jgi:hypothetical protein
VLYISLVEFGYPGPALIFGRIEKLLRFGKAL